MDTSNPFFKYYISIGMTENRTYSLKNVHTYGSTSIITDRCVITTSENPVLKQIYPYEYMQNCLIWRGAVGQCILFVPSMKSNACEMYAFDCKININKFSCVYFIEDENIMVIDGGGMPVQTVSSYEFHEMNRMLRPSELGMYARKTL